MVIIMQYAQRRNLRNEALADLLYMYLLKSVMPYDVGRSLSSNFFKLQEILFEDLKCKNLSNGLGVHVKNNKAVQKDGMER